MEELDLPAEANHKIGDYPSKHFLDSYTTALIGHCNLLGRGELLGNGIARQINDVNIPFSAVMVF